MGGAEGTPGETRNGAVFHIILGKRQRIDRVIPNGAGTRLRVGERDPNEERMWDKAGYNALVNVTPTSLGIGQSFRTVYEPRPLHFGIPPLRKTYGRDDTAWRAPHGW